MEFATLFKASDYIAQAMGAIKRALRWAIMTFVVVSIVAFIGAPSLFHITFFTPKAVTMVISFSMLAGLASIVLDIWFAMRKQQGDIVIASPNQ